MPNRPPTARQPPANPSNHQVLQGDSLSSIALRFTTTVASLVSVNPELVRGEGGVAGEGRYKDSKHTACPLTS